MTEVTICAKCRYYAVLVADHACFAPVQEKTLDFVTGEMTYPSGLSYCYCYDVNTDGKCKDYVARNA